jgi:hypothetical protein
MVLLGVIGVLWSVGSTRHHAARCPEHLASFSSPTHLARQTNTRSPRAPSALDGIRPFSPLASPSSDAPRALLYLFVSLWPPRTIATSQAPEGTLAREASLSLFSGRASRQLTALVLHSTPPFDALTTAPPLPPAPRCVPRHATRPRCLLYASATYTHPNGARLTAIAYVNLSSSDAGWLYGSATR